MEQELKNSNVVFRRFIYSPVIHSAKYNVRITREVMLRTTYRQPKLLQALTSYHKRKNTLKQRLLL